MFGSIYLLAFGVPKRLGTGFLCRTTLNTSQLFLQRITDEKLVVFLLHTPVCRCEICVCVCVAVLELRSFYQPADEGQTFPVSIN